MAREIINIGPVQDDGSGDQARVVGQKVNRMTEELYTRVSNIALMNVVAGPVTQLAAGAPPTAALTGTAPNYTLNLGLPAGPAGAGAPTSADILAIAERDDILREMAAAGVVDQSSVFLDFIRGTHWVKGRVISASIPTLIAALGGGSVFNRASIAGYFDKDGLLKTAASGVPRILYDPVTRLPRGWLVEPSRTNLLLRSEDFASASVGKVGITVLADASVAPDGLTTMDRIVEDTTTAAHYAQVNVTSITSGTAYAQSVFAREPAGNLSKRYLLLLMPAVNFGSNVYAFFDLATGVASGASGGAVPTIQNVGNGIWRCSIAATAAATGSATCQFRLSPVTSGLAAHLGDGVSGMDVWGAQLEAGNTPSFYIPTSASTVARQGEAYVLDLAAGFFGLTEGTVFLECESDIPIGSNNRPASFDDVPTTPLNQIYFARNANGNGAFVVVENGVTVVSTTAGLPWPANGIARGAARYKPGDLAYSWQGAIAGTRNTNVGFSALNRILSGTGAPQIVRRIGYWPKGLSDTKLNALTNSANWS